MGNGPLAPSARRPSSTIARWRRGLAAPMPHMSIGMSSTIMSSRSTPAACARALSEVFASIPGAMESAMPTVEGLTETMAVLIARAQAAGVLREDMIVDDIPMLMCGIGAATKKEHRCAAAWRRHLAIVLDGLRAGGASGPLPT